jgi:hypothetical protein
METQTKITSANVKVTIESNKSFFSIELGLTNEENGLQLSEVNKAREDAQELAKTAALQYKSSLVADPKAERKKIQDTIDHLKNQLENTPKAETEPTPEEIAEVESLPMYGEKKISKPKK